jgi:SAM-dependent methyltransferase
MSKDHGLAAGRSSRLPRFLQPAYIDEGRFIVQAPVFQRLLKDIQLCGPCLNAGCGELMYFDWLDALPGLTQVVHLDVTANAAEGVRGNQRHISVPGSLTELPFPDGSFQFVFCTEVLEHILDHHKAVAEINRVLVPGGLALISTPTPPAPFDPNHVREGYRLEEMNELLKSHGLTILQHRYTFYFLFRAFYVTWSRLTRLRRGVSAVPRLVVRGWCRLETMFPFGKPWDIAVLATKDER